MLRTILVVEDDPSVMRVLRLALRSAGFEVIGAVTGGQALKVLGQSRVGAVMLDLGLPDGLAGEVLAWLRRAAAVGSPGWLVFSALDPGEVEKKFGRLGDRLVSKPFDAWQIVRRIEGQLGEAPSGP